MRVGCQKQPPDHNTIAARTKRRLDAGPFGSHFTFTGEQADINGLLYLRARTYHPALGVFASLDPVEGALRQAMSLNRYGYVAGNVMNITDPTGMVWEQPGSGLNLSILRGGFDPIIQQPCFGSAHSSPFGCDQNAQPIPYVVIRGFRAGGYEVGVSPENSSCRLWNNTASWEHHCGIDMVSYSDPGWLWHLEGNDPPILVMDVIPTDLNIESPAWFNAYTGKVAPENTPIDAFDQWIGPLTQRQFQQARFRYQGHQYESGPVEGRAVYAIRSGFVTGYDGESATLKVEEPPDYPGEPLQLMTSRLEIQYTHVLPLQSIRDKLQRGQQPYIRVGQHIGYYAYIGSTSEPHLHVLYKQINIPANSGCPPEDYYLNPTSPRGRAGTQVQFSLTSMWVPSSRRPGGYPDHILAKGSYSIHSMGTEHPLYEPPELP